MSQTSLPMADIQYGSVDTHADTYSNLFAMAQAM